MSGETRTMDKTILAAAALLAAVATPALALAQGAAPAAPTAPRQPMTAAASMAMTDANKDGMITRAEAEAAKWKKAEFERGDLNKDGKITLEELKAAMIANGEKP